jgi:hypothetical protein
MPLDPVIAQGFRGIELQNPLDAYARVNQLQQAQQQNQLNALKMQEYQRENATNNAVNQAYQAAYDPSTGAYDMNKLRGAVIGAGAGVKLPGIEKQMGELRTQQLAQTKAEAEAVTQKLTQSRTLLDTIDPADPSAPQQFMAWHEVNHKDPVLGPVLQRMGVTAEQSRARIAQAVSQGPEAIAELIAQSREGQTKFAERFKPMVVAQGASVYQPGRTGAVFTAPVAPAKATPAETEEIVMRLQDPSLPPPLRQALQSRLTMLTTREPKEPREPREPSAPVAVVDETTGTVKYVTRGEAIGKTPANAIEGLTPKERQKREASFPQATSSVKSFEYKTDQFIKELIKLRDDPGLDQITGPVYGRTPSVSREGSRAQAAYNKIFAKGGFQALQDLREASKNGGALGNVSNQEGERLERSVVGGLDRTQNKKDVQNGIDDLIADLKVSKERVRAAFDDTYQYKQGGAAAPTTKPSLDSIFAPK